MSDRLIRFVQGEYDYLLAREGRDFFLALAPYANALNGREVIREILMTLEAEIQANLDAFVAEQNDLIDEARAIRIELAERAPEIDNSDMDEPENPAAREWLTYENDSLAKFDRLVEADHRIAFPGLPQDDVDPGPMSRLLQILRGRLMTAEYGPDGNISAPPMRDDLGDLSRRIANLGERQRASVQRYGQASRTLAGLALARLVSFGSDLIAEPVAIETDEDVVAVLDRTLREWLQPKALARRLASGERLDDVERRIVAETEASLKREAELCHREIVRRLELRRRSFGQFVREEPLVVTIVGGVIAAVIAGIILALI